MRLELARTLLLLTIAGAYGFAEPAPAALGAAPDTLTVWRFNSSPTPDPLPRPRWGAASAVFNGTLYLFGGFDGSRWLDEVLRLDPATGHWSKAAPLPASALGNSAVVAGDRIVIAGAAGARSETYLYNPAEDSWSGGPLLLHERAGTKFVGGRGGVVALSGIDRAGHGVAAIEVLSGGEWRDAGLMPFQHDNVAVASRGGKIYVAGGYDSSPGAAPDSLTAFDEYDPAARKWRRLPPMPTARAAAKAAELGGMIYVVGGLGSSRAPYLAVDDVEVFDPKSETWSKGPRLPRAVHSPAVATLGGRLYVFGGSPQGQPGTTAVQIFDPATRSWSVSANDPAAATAPRRQPRPAPMAAPSEPPAEAAPSWSFKRRSPERPHDYALVIGVGTYQALPAADYAENDARDAAAAFGALGVPEENIVALSGPRATLAEMAKYIEEWLPRRVSPDSRVYFYFSGHGAPDVKDGSAYLMPWDGDAAYVKSTGFPLTRLYKSLGALPAAHVIALIDSCFSGAGGRSVLLAGTRPLVSVRLPENLPPRISVLAASESQEIAGSLPARGHGLFSDYAFEGLSGAADLHGSGHLTLEGLFSYVHKHVIIDARREKREQTPTLTTPTPKLRLY